MPTGTIKWYNQVKGFGFILPDEGGSDLFIHRSAVEAAGMSPPRDGERLSYNLGRDPHHGRPIATDLTRIEASAEGVMEHEVHHEPQRAAG